jgi:hypothetical protein
MLFLWAIGVSAIFVVVRVVAAIYTRYRLGLGFV